MASEYESKKFLKNAGTAIAAVISFLTLRYLISYSLSEFNFLTESQLLIWSYIPLLILYVFGIAYLFLKLKKDTLKKSYEFIAKNIKNIIIIFLLIIIAFLIYKIQFGSELQKCPESTGQQEENIKIENRWDKGWNTKNETNFDKSGLLILNQFGDIVNGVYLNEQHDTIKLYGHNQNDTLVKGTWNNITINIHGDFIIGSTINNNIYIDGIESARINGEQIKPENVRNELERFLSEQVVPSPIIPEGEEEKEIDGGKTSGVATVDLDSLENYYLENFDYTLIGIKYMESNAYQRTILTLEDGSTPGVNDRPNKLIINPHDETAIIKFMNQVSGETDVLSDNYTATVYIDPDKIFDPVKTENTKYMWVRMTDIKIRRNED